MESPGSEAARKRMRPDMEEEEDDGDIQNVMLTIAVQGAPVQNQNENEARELVPVPNDAQAPGNIRNVSLAIAVLLIVASYQAAINPPGGILATRDFMFDGAFKLLIFMAVNTMTFLLSIEILCSLSSGYPYTTSVRTALFALSVSYVWIVVIVTPLPAVFPIGMCFFMCGVVYFLRVFRQRRFPAAF